MEAAGLAIGVAGLAGLFSACVECFNYIDAGRRYEYDSEILIAKLHIQHVRLYLWGYLVGLTGDIEQENLNILAQQELGVKLCLGGIRTLLTSSNDLIEKYGLVGADDDGGELEDERARSINRVGRLRSSLATLLPKQNTVNAGLDVLGRAKWAIRDKERFVTLVEDLKDFVDGLQGVVPAILPRHNRLVERGISNISDNEALKLVLEATDEDYPEWSETASVALRKKTQPSLKQHRLLAWMEDDAVSDAESAVNNAGGSGRRIISPQEPELGHRNRIGSLVNRLNLRKLKRPSTPSPDLDVRVQRPLDPLDVQQQRAVLRRFTKACYENMSPHECLDIIGTNQDLSMKHIGGSTWAHVAVECDRREVLEALILAGADVDARDCDGRSPLMLAAKADNGYIVTQLIESGANIEAKDDEGRTALFFAMCHSMLRRKYWRHESCALNALVRAGGDVNARDKHGATPLHHFLTWVQTAAQSTAQSTEYGVCGPLQRLEELKQDLDLTAKSHSGISILDLLAIAHRKVYDGEELAVKCIAQGARIKPRSRSWKHDLARACRKSDLPYVKYLVWRSEVSGEKNISSVRFQDALLASIEARSQPVADFLVSHLVNGIGEWPDGSKLKAWGPEKGRSILHAAVENDLPELADVLKKYVDGET